MRSRAGDGAAVYLGPLLRPLLLLLLAEEPSHGYALMDRLGELGIRPRQAGSVYRELRDLEAAGLITSAWYAAETRGPARRMYRVTRSGRRTLDNLMPSVQTLAGALAATVARHRTLSGSQPTRRQRPPGGRIKAAAARVGAAKAG